MLILIYIMTLVALAVVTVELAKRANMSEFDNVYANKIAEVASTPSIWAFYKAAFSPSLISLYYKNAWKASKVYALFAFVTNIVGLPIAIPLVVLTGLLYLIPTKAVAK